MRLLLLLAALLAGAAQAEIYKCIEAGRVTYSNVQLKNCTRLNVGPPNTIPADRVSGANGRVESAAGFPRIDADTQRSRDDGRRRILDAELTSEQNALDAARKALAEQGSPANQAARDRVALHERNIEALRKEIANLR